MDLVELDLVYVAVLEENGHGVVALAIGEGRDAKLGGENVHR